MLETWWLVNSQEQSKNVLSVDMFLHIINDCCFSSLLTSGVGGFCSQHHSRQSRRFLPIFKEFSQKNDDQIVYCSPF